MNLKRMFQILQNQRVVYETNKENKLYIGSLHDNTLEEIWNNDRMKDIRIKMLKGEPIGKTMRHVIILNQLLDHLRELDI